MKRKSQKAYRRLIRAAIIATAACIFMTPQAKAASAGSGDYFDLPPEQLLAAEVTSVSRRSERLAEAPAAVYVITRDDILRSGVTTIPDALRMAPGVNVAQADANSWAVSIRGFNGTTANKLLVMIDGRTVYNPAFAGVFWEAQDLVLADIDRIEVVRGPGGTLWGANAVNGVINIITAKASATQGDYATAVYGTQESTIAARHGGALADGGAYRVYAKAFDRDNFDRGNGSGANDAWNSLRSGFRADWDNYTLQGDVYRTKTDQNDFIPNFGPGFGTVIDNTLDYTGGNLLQRWKKQTESGGLLTLQSYIDYASRIDPQIIDDRHFTLDAEAQYNLAARGRHEIVVGGGYRLVTSNESNSAEFQVNPASRTDNTFNLFVQDKITLLPDNLFLTLGTKVEHNDYSGFELEPGASLNWTPNERQTLWASIARAVRTPTLLEQNAFVIAQDGAGSQVRLVPNGNFASEVLIAYETGYRQQVSKDVSLDAALFFNDYSKLASFHSLPGFVVNNGIDPPFTVTPIEFGNSMTAETYGGELTASWNVRPDWTLKGSYSYINIEAHSHDSSFGNQETAEGLTPHHQVNLRSDWKISDDWSLNTSAYLVSGLDTSHVSAYTRLDANLGYRISDGVDANLIGQNLLQASHREFGTAGGLNAAEVPRAVYGRVTWHY